jgi:hypothetical protein
VKTGRLLKFQRPGAEIHAYLYQEEDACRASIFVRPGTGQPAEEVRAEDMAELEQAVRSWIDGRFPKPEPHQR